jgi:hypothetical protein
VIFRTDAFYYSMRKTQCDEDRYARESTLRAKSTLGSESLWKENSRLQEHQQRCQKQPSNPQRFHVTACATESVAPAYALNKACNSSWLSAEE